MALFQVAYASGYRAEIFQIDSLPGSDALTLLTTADSNRFGIQISVPLATVAKFSDAVLAIGRQIKPLNIEADGLEKMKTTSKDKVLWGEFLKEHTGVEPT